MVRIGEFMLGKIISIDENMVTVSINFVSIKLTNVINMHVLLEDTDSKIIGEIIQVDQDRAKIKLLGEIVSGKFVFGVIKKPSFSAIVKLIPKEKIPLIIGMPNYNEKKDLYLGKSAIYHGVDLGVNINNFFGNHFAIFGSTGSGKSCSVARIFQNLFLHKKEVQAYKSSIFIFDAYGEYRPAFSPISEMDNDLNFKTYTTNTKFEDSEVLKIPVWLLGIDDLAILLGADKHNQLPIIEKALKLVNMFTRQEKETLKHKNDIISRAILDIMASGRPSVQIRDQIVSILAHYHTSALNLETKIVQPGYTRPLRHLLIVDASGKMREAELLTNFFESFIQEDLDYELPDGSFKYSLKDLKDAFDFALISEGVLKIDRVYDDSNVLRVRLHSLINSDYSKFFDYPEYVSREQFIKVLLTAASGKKAQIVNFNLNYIDDRFAKVITKIYSKLLFDYTREGSENEMRPFHIILEEAHRYVQHDNDVNLLGYNIFERITKEGRKHGIMLGLISQRPSELSETTLSQCANFLIFKMLHPTDISYIREMVPNITEETIKMVKILQPGSCVAFGSGFNVPVIIKFDMPNPPPDSRSVDISQVWFINKKNNQTLEN